MRARLSFCVYVTAAVVVCGGMSWSCAARDPENPASASDANESRDGQAVVLFVEETPYTQADFSHYVTRTAGEEAAQLTGAVLSRLFDSYLEEKLLLAEALDWVETLEPAEKESLISQGGGRIPDDRQMLEIWGRILTRDITVAPEEITAYYSEHKRDFLKPARVRVSQILLATENKAVQALDMIKDLDEARFREVARQMSTGVEADKGGVMGVFELGQLPTEMETVIFALQEGESSRIVESAYGYHVFRLDAKYPPELVTEEEAAGEIADTILEDKYQAYLAAHLASLRDRMDWRAETGNLFFTYEPGIIQRNEHE